MGASILAVAKSIYYFRQHGSRNNFRFPFSSLLTLLLSLLYKRRVAMRFPAKITSSCIGLPYLLIELFYIGIPVLRMDGFSVYGHVITKFSRMGRLLHFLTHGAPLARFASESSAIKVYIKILKFI